MTGKIWHVDLDPEGRVQLPAELQKRLGIGPGSQLALVLINQSVYLHPIPAGEPVSEGPLPTTF